MYSIKKGYSLPTCDKCGHTLNPALEDDSDIYWLVNGEKVCLYCMIDYLKELVDSDTEWVSEQLGYHMIRFGE